MVTRRKYEYIVTLGTPWWCCPSFSPFSDVHLSTFGNKTFSQNPIMIFCIIVVLLWWRAGSLDINYRLLTCKWPTKLPPNNVKLRRPKAWWLYMSHCCRNSENSNRGNSNIADSNIWDSNGSKKLSIFQVFLDHFQWQFLFWERLFW